jgi:hypothetical protein
MLRVYFGSLADEIYNTDLYFKNSYKDEWLSDDFVKEMIKEIDNSEVIENNAIKNDILGTFSPTGLSGGVKTLILIYFNPKIIFNISNCGDNCIPFLFKIVQKREETIKTNKDITVCLHHFLKLPNGMSVKVINDGKRKVITDPIEFLMLANDYLRRD